MDFMTRGQPTSEPLADRVKSFDSKLGNEIGISGYKAISEAHQDILRNLLMESGYEIAQRHKSDNKDCHFPYDQEKRLYIRASKVGIDFFSEMNLSDGKEGLSYAHCRRYSEAKIFERDYQKAYGPDSRTYELTLLGGVLGAAGSTTLSISHLIEKTNQDTIELIQNGAILAICSSAILLGIPYVIHTIRKNNAIDRIKKLNINCAPREAINLALGYTPQEEKVAWNYSFITFHINLKYSKYPFAISLS